MLKLSNENIEEASDALISRCTKHIDGGLAILNEEDGASQKLLEVFTGTARMRGWFDVSIHGCDEGDPFGFFCIHAPGSNKERVRYYITPKKLARVIRDYAYSRRSQMSIRLFACHGSWEDESGISLAQQLSKHLKTEVLASNKSNVNWAGTGFAACPPRIERGETRYTIFHPREDERKLTLNDIDTPKTVALGAKDKKHHW